MPPPNIHPSNSPRWIVLIVVALLQYIVLGVGLYMYPQYCKTDLHDSALSSRAWLSELLTGHPDRIYIALGMRRHVFLALWVQKKCRGRDATRKLRRKIVWEVLLHNSKALEMLALEWVQKHISTFGGDPSRVVLGGQSAGAVSTGLHLLSNKPNSTSLFRGAIMMSGSPWASPHANSTQAQATYDGLVRANNCTAARETLECLRHVPFDAFMESVNETPNVFSHSSLALVWRPRVDGDIVQRSPVEAVRDGEVAKIPIMAGGCDDEGTLFAFSSTNVTTDFEFAQFIQTQFLPTATPEQISRIAALYPQDSASGSPFGTGDQNQLTPQFKRSAAFQGDLSFTSLRRLFLTHASKTQYAWSWVSKRGKSTPLIGASHSSDLFMFFPPPISSVADTDTDTAAVDYFINFINTLDPNLSAASGQLSHQPKHSTFWPKWTEESARRLLTFSDPLTVSVIRDDFRAEEIEFLNELHLAGVTSRGL